MATSQTTTSTTYTDLTTVGPSVTVTVPASGNIIVILTAQMGNASNGDEVYMSFSGGGIAVSDARALVWTGRNTGDVFIGSATFYVTGVSTGSQTFTAKYKTAAGTATIANRNIVVIPVP
ncbi:MAG: hypothetical protein ACKOTZ_07295 [Chloroflexota bacterium]